MTETERNKAGASLGATAPDPSAASLMTIELDMPEGRLRGRVAIPHGRIRLPELAFSMMPLVDRVMDLAVRRETEQGRAISCCKGCGVCCRQVVPLSPPEAWMLADLLAALPEAQRRGALERFRAVTETLLRHGFKERFLAPQETDEQINALGRDYFKLGLACPFLVDEACSIHPYRPSMCREYLVTTPADRCGDPFAHPIGRVKVSIRLSEALSRLSADLLGGAPQLIPLTLAPAWAAEQREAGARAWEGRELFDRLLEHMQKRSADEKKAP